MNSAFRMVLIIAFCGIGNTSAQEMANAPNVVPNTTEAMQSAEYWISRIDNPDRVLLSEQQIKLMNAKNGSLPGPIPDVYGNAHDIHEVIAQKDRIGLQYNIVDPLKLRSFPGDSLRARFRDSREFLEGRTYYDRREKEWDESMKSALLDLMNMGDVDEVIVPRHGILVERAMVRAFPTDEPGAGGRGSWLDQFQSGSFDAGMPVAVLHATEIGDWYYVRGETGFGWIHADIVAFGDPDTLGEYVHDGNFIVSVDYRVPVYTDPSFGTFMVHLYLGSRFRLVEQTGLGYRVSVPRRASDGSFITADGWIPPGAAVSRGYQPFTQRNVLTTMFNMLYQPYCWADADYGFDCCGTIRVVLRTFGIMTGRWTSFILFGGTDIAAFPRDTPAAEKYGYLAGRAPGVTFVGDPGHISMYIGEVDGRYYVIHQGGYSYKDENGVEMLFRRVNVNDTELSGGSNVRTWTNISTYGE